MRLSFIGIIVIFQLINAWQGIQGALVADERTRSVKGGVTHRELKKKTKKTKKSKSKSPTASPSMPPSKKIHNACNDEGFWTHGEFSDDAFPRKFLVNTGSPFFKIRWDFYSSADQLIVSCDGKILYDTTVTKVPGSDQVDASSCNSNVVEAFFNGYTGYDIWVYCGLTGAPSSVPSKAPSSSSVPSKAPSSSSAPSLSSAPSKTPTGAPMVD